MKILILLLLFFCYMNVDAKTIITPYLKIEEVDTNYRCNDKERIEKVTYYELEKINRDFKYLERPFKEYKIKGDKVKYGEYGEYQKERLENSNLDEDVKTIYYYQELKKIDSLIIKNINNLMISKVTLKYKDKVIYNCDKTSDVYKIKLSKKYSPEYLTLEVKCFLNQGDLKGSFEVLHSNYIKEKIEVTTKGINNITIALINCLSKTIYDEKIVKASSVSDNFYINIIKKEKLYRYRKKYYQYYKDENVIDTKILDGYRVIRTFDKYYLYRKEEIEVFDEINLDSYLDLDKVIKRSTVPLSKLEFIYENNCGETDLVIKYKDFKETVDVTFNCYNPSKSRVRVGKTKSFGRVIWGFLFETLFLRNL